MNDTQHIVWTPTSLEAADNGCSRRLHHALEQSRRRREGLEKLGEITSQAASDGTLFHRIVEALQQAEEEDRPAAALTLVEQEAASVSVAESVDAWLTNFVPLGECLGVEMGRAINADGNMVEFSDPSAWIRCIIDRVEVIYAEEDGEILITDWKRGWSGWKRMQMEICVLTIDAWLRDHFDEMAEAPITTIRAVVWSPAARSTTECDVWPRDPDSMERLRARVKRYTDAANALQKRPPTEERVGDGCRWCPIRGECGSYLRLPVVPWVREEPQTVEAASDLARMWAAMKHATAEIEAVLRRYLHDTGEPLDAGGAIITIATTIERKLDAEAIYSACLDPVKGRFAEAADPDLLPGVQKEVAAFLAYRLPIGMEGAKKAARKILPKDKAGQAGLISSWTMQEKHKPRIKIDRGIPEDDEESAGG